MATVAIVSFGSRGDLYPLLGIGRSMRANGHQVTVFEYDEYQPDIEATGLGFGLLGQGSGCHDVFRHPTEPAGALRLLTRKVAMPETLTAVETIIRSSQRFDVVVAHHFQYIGQLSAELMRVPLVSVLGSDVADLYYPPPTAAAAEHDRSRRVFRVVDRMATPAVNGVRHRLGLAELPHAGTTGSLSRDAVLVTASQLVGTGDEHWPCHARRCGYPPYDGGDGWRMPAVVRSFLDREDLGPLLVCTLGDSWASEFPQACLNLAQVARERRCRVLYLFCRGSLPPMGEHCLAWPFVPLSKLLTRAVLIMHHAGRGTLFAALRAGLPSLLVPHWLDGFANARRAAELGVGREVDADMGLDELRRAVADLLDAEAYRNNAERAAAVIESDPDPGVVAEQCLQLARSRGPACG